MKRDHDDARLRRSTGIAAGALAAALLAACAGSRGAPRQTDGLRALQDWAAGDVSAISRVDRALQRDPADPWTLYAAALRARRALDVDSEARHLAALVERAPGHLLALPAIRRMSDLVEASPAIARDVAQALERAAATGRLTGLAAYRGRMARTSVAELAGDVAGAERLRGEGGLVREWTVLGPLGAYHALQMDEPFAPEQGPLPERMQGAPGVGVVSARVIPAPDGVASLEGEPLDADIYYLAADVTLSRGGDYLVAVGGGSSFRAWLDGEPLAERRDYAAWLPVAQAVPRTLGAGTHRLLVKIGRGAAPGSFGVAFARADGAPSDAAARAAAPGAPAPAVRAGPLPRPVLGPADLARALEPEGGPVLARLVAAGDSVDVDREGAKELVLEAARRAPRSALLEGLRGEIVAGDPTLPDRVGQPRAEAAWVRALELDPGDAPSRLALATSALAGERLDDAAGQLGELGAQEQETPSALLVRARVLAARGVLDGAERAAEQARRASGLCGATALLLDLAGRRDALAREDELAQVFARCPGGLRRVADLRRRRGDPGQVLALLDARARAAPADIEARLAYAAALAAAGDTAGAARQTAELSAIWPRDPRIPKRQAELLEQAGDRAGARAALERALALDGSDLRVRRALALDDGTEPLADLAEDGLAAIEAYQAAKPREETSSVVVLDAAAVEIHPDGSQTQRVHEVHKVRDESAADKLGEVQLPPGAQPLTIRTVKRDGRILEPPEVSADKGTVSLSGLEPGDFVETEWIRSTPRRGAAVPGLVVDPFFFRADVPLWRTRYVVRAPRGSGLEVDARNLAAPQVKVQGEWEVLRAGDDAVVPARVEPAAPSESEFLPWVQVGVDGTRDGLARAIGDGFVERLRPTLELRQLAREIAATVPEADRRGDALLRAAWRRVANDVMGTGGSIGESASHVLARGRGSRTVLLAAVLRELGVDVRLALVRDFGQDPAPRRFASADLHSRPVLRVAHGGKTWWLDPSQGAAPFGVLPGPMRGVEALVIPAPGEAPAVERTPEDGGVADPVTIDAVITVAEDGSATVEGSETYTGWEAAAGKHALERVDASAQRQAVEQSLARSFRDLQLGSLTIDGAGDPDAPLVVRWKFSAPGWAHQDSGWLVADVPLFPARLAAQYAARGSRETPLLLGDPQDTTVNVKVVPPPGWSAAPRPRRAEGEQGSYVRDERADGSALVRTDRFVLRRGRLAPERYPAFAELARAIDAAQEAPLLFERSMPRASLTPRVSAAPGASAATAGAPTHLRVAAKGEQGF